MSATPTCHVCGHAGRGLIHFAPTRGASGEWSEEFWLCNAIAACQQRQLRQGYWVGSDRAKPGERIVKRPATAR